MASSYSKDPQVDRSLRHSVRDGVAYSVMSGGGESYFSAYAMHLRATSTEVGILASLPTLIGSMAQLISVLLGRRAGSRRSLIIAGAYLQVAAWLPLIVLPFLFPDWSLMILLGCLVLFYAAGNLISPQWSSLMADLVPTRWRGRYFAERTRLATITGLIALIAAGMVLEQFADSRFAVVGFLTIFTVAAIARLVSAYHLSRMHEPPRQPVTTSATNAVEADEGGARGTQSVQGQGFMRLSLFNASMQFSVGIAGPFFNVFMLRDLQFSYMEFTALTATSVLLQFLTLSAWGRVADSFGSRRVMAATGFLIPVLPALWLFSGDFTFLLLVQACTGVIWAGFSLALSNFSFDLLPSVGRESSLALFNVAGSLGMFLGVLLGGYLGTALPLDGVIWGFEYEWTSVLSAVFLISALARLLVVMVFLPRFRDVRPARPLTLDRLLFRITGSRRWLRSGVGARACEEARLDA